MQDHLSFSRFDILIEREAERLTREAELKPAPPFPDALCSPSATRERRERARRDFWFFDQVYFPPESYQDYAPPGEYHRDLVKRAQLPGIHIEAGPRGWAKTVTLKKFTAWLYFAGLLEVGMAYSATLDHASPLLQSIFRILTENPRIEHDFAPTIYQGSAESFDIGSRHFAHRCMMSIYSLRRSARGTSRDFNRPTFCIGDDLQTKNSPLGSEANREVVQRISETYKSMTPGSTMVVAGNNFDTECYIEDLRKQKELGTLPAHWDVSITPAWQPETGSTWPERYEAETEEELMTLVEADDEEDWGGNFQGCPTHRDGRIFPRSKYATYTALPLDVIGVAWNDPNLSLKSAGDTTAMGALLWSRSTGKYYVALASARSYADHEKLLDDYLSIKTVLLRRIPYMGFDGNVNQEVNWTLFVRTWCKLRNRPYPKLHYRKYHVDSLAKNAQLAWNAGDILFPEGFRETENGTVFTNQIFKFAGKKKNKKDDAPDWLISAFEFIHEMNIARPGRSRSGSKSRTPIVHADYYSGI